MGHLYNSLPTKKSSAVTSYPGPPRPPMLQPPAGGHASGHGSTSYRNIGVNDEFPTRGIQPVNGVTGAENGGVAAGFA